MKSRIERLKAVAQKFEDKLKGIKVLAFDCDGILTDGKVYWAGEEAGFSRSFHVHDGYGMKFMQRNGYKVGVITGGNSPSVYKRVNDYLKLDFLFAGNENKFDAFESLLKMGFKAEEVLYMGDELFDIPLLERAGFSATAPEAYEDVRAKVDYITETPAGLGSAREVIEILRYANNLSYESSVIH